MYVIPNWCRPLRGWKTRPEKERRGRPNRHHSIPAPRERGLIQKNKQTSVFMFSVTGPVGIIAGIVITDVWDSHASNLAAGLLQGIACGTFLYMTFFEMFPAEFNYARDRMLKLLLLVLGFSTVTAVLFFSSEVKKPFCKVFND